MEKKNLHWEIITEARSQKYILVKKTEGKFSIFRTPPIASEGSKNQVSLGEWEGEIVPWGTIPKGVRKVILRKRVKPSTSDQNLLVPT